MIVEIPLFFVPTKLLNLENLKIEMK